MIITRNTLITFQENKFDKFIRPLRIFNFCGRRDLARETSHTLLQSPALWLTFTTVCILSKEV